MLICLRKGLPMLLAAALTGSSLPVLAENPPMIDELRDIVDKSRRERAADRWLQNALEDLLLKYDTPVQSDILFEDFSDGDYSRNPTWQVLQGHFEVIRGQGLVSRVNDGTGSGVTANGAPPPASTADALSGLIVGALLDRALGPQDSASASESGTVAGSTGPAEIRLKAGVSNAFVLDLGFRQDASADAVVELALLQSEAGRYGYRLRLHSGRQGFIELQRIRGGQGAIVQTRGLSRSFADGQLHELSWRQSPDGTVTVLVDGRTLLSVRDRAFRDPYPWLHLRNEQGALTVRSLRVSGS